MNITIDTAKNKAELLKYFRYRSSEFIAEVNKEYGNTEYKKKAKKLNTLISRARNTIIEIVEQNGKSDNWSNQEVLECVLMVTYCNFVVMLEVRNSVWPYEYMAFSRRVGELWEPFCKLTFEYPINDLKLFVPPLFADVKKQLADEVQEYITNLDILEEQKEQLTKYYDKVWGLVMSGEIQLELDLHFIFEGKKYVVDFKSGFGSNEKGNVNRLLLVAGIYHNLEDDYEPLIFVRATENNNYFDTLKNSKTWSAFSGTDTYKELHKYSGYDISAWIVDNINWIEDLDSAFVKHLKENDLIQYLTW
ncbi:hypothetical protein KORDIASMS9_02717 [Kordia sp. SMS9]|uniref:hypothetical protein n=1 Tax=Kordia sp. SMS9 TaxID=2282170 RepID=UPI000E0E0626|nr:hypothetical protein [Kordia sp. SMS9]AXG70477.1 hypothetical protein KORDIASMS9_02717 [Kordia sp. SMS9]